MFINPKSQWQWQASKKDYVAQKYLIHPHCVSVPALIIAYLLAQNGQVLNTQSG
jgi:hypothetical protein